MFDSKFLKHQTIWTVCDVCETKEFIVTFVLVCSSHKGISVQKSCIQESVDVVRQAAFP